MVTSTPKQEPEEDFIPTPEPVREQTSEPTVIGSIVPEQTSDAPEVPRNFRAYMSDGELELWDERAGIREYDGGLTREQAEAGAYQDIMQIRSESYNQNTMNLIQELDMIEIGNFARFDYAVA